MNKGSTSSSTDIVVDVYDFLYSFSGYKIEKYDTVHMVQNMRLMQG